MTRQEMLVYDEALNVSNVPGKNSPLRYDFFTNDPLRRRLDGAGSLRTGGTNRERH